MPNFANDSIIVKYVTKRDESKNFVSVIRSDRRGANSIRRIANIDIGCNSLANFLHQSVEGEAREIFPEGGLRLADQYPDGRPKIATTVTTQFVKLTRSLVKQTLHVVDSTIRLWFLNLNDPNFITNRKEILKILSFIPGLKEIIFEESLFRIGQNVNLANEIFKEIISSILNDLSIHSIKFNRLFDFSLEESQIKILAEALATNTSLTSLDLINSNLGYKGAKKFAEALTTNTSLTALDLTGGRLGDEGAKAIAEALAINTSLTSLNLSFNKLGEESGKALAKVLATSTSLTVLNLSNNDLGEEGGKAISEALATNTSLTSLSLSFNKLGKEGQKALAKAIYVRELSGAPKLEILFHLPLTLSEEERKAVKDEFDRHLEQEFTTDPSSRLPDAAAAHVATASGHVSEGTPSSHPLNVGVGTNNVGIIGRKDICIVQ